MNLAPPAPRKPSAGAALALDEHQRGLLKRFLRDWVYPRWRELIIAMILTGLLAAVTGAYPMIIKASFDMLMQDQKGTLPYVLAAIVGATMLRSILLYAQTVETNRIVMRLTTDMQRVGFEHLITSDFARLSRETPGRLVSKLTNDIGFVQVAAQAALNTAVRDALLIVALVASMIYLDWVMSLIVLCVYPIAALPVAALSQKLRRVAKQTQEELGGMTSLLTEKLSGARLIKSFRLEDYAADRLNKSFEHVYKLRMKAVKNRARIDPLLEALGGIAIAGVIALAYWRIASGISTVGDFMGFITALLMASQPIRALGSLSGRINEGLAAAESFYDLVDEKPLIVDRPGAKPLAIATSAIRFEDVGFAYDRSGVQAISGPLAQCAGRPYGGARRPLRRRQVDRAQPCAAPVRRRHRPHQHRRTGHPRCHACLAARRHLHRRAGRDAVRRYDRGQHCPRPARRAAVGDRGGGRGGRRP